MKTLVLALSLLLMAGEPDPLTLSLSPTFQPALGTVTYRMRVEPHRENIALCVGFESESAESRSCRSLDGIEANKYHEIVFKNLPPGNYVGYAQLFRVSNHVKSLKTVPFRVTEGDL